MQDILINWTPQETRVAVIERGAVQELYMERTLERGLVGNIYAAKVMRVLPGMQSAFVDIGLDRDAFLHASDIHVPSPTPQPHEGKPVHTAPIEKLVFQGQKLIVQVIKDPIGSKAARVTTQICMAGRMVVFLPHDHHIGVSQKISSAQTRESLRARVQALAAQSNTGALGGFILRTNAQEAADQDLVQDITYLRKAWSVVYERSHSAAAGTLLYKDLDLAQRVLRDMVQDQAALIHIDSQEQFVRLQAFGQELTYGAVTSIRLYEGDRPLFDMHNVDLEITQALSRRVNLPSGGYLVFDQTEALVTVDVNTGSYVGAHNVDDTVCVTNLEAAEVLARQLRLRNLGGIIIIDLIDMARAEHQSLVLERLRSELRHDRTKVMLGGFTSLGLIELTRKRTRKSLAEMLCVPCPTCSGTGKIKSARTVCYEILREVQCQAQKFDPQSFKIVACAQVVQMLRSEESQHLAALVKHIAKPISLLIDAEAAVEVFDIVLVS